jgi:hypothetical protein
MRHLESLKVFEKIKSLLASLDDETQLFLVWSHLISLLEKDKDPIAWLIIRIEELLEEKKKIKLDKIN